jgi:chemotaxis family two-component system response regulator Rcp1
MFVDFAGRRVTIKAASEIVSMAADDPLPSTATHQKRTQRRGMPIKVLLVEDNPGDVRLTREVLLATNRSIHLLVASDGEEAVAMLKRDGSKALAPRPDLILLDLNLPKMDGREVLARIKADPDLKTIPTVVLTTSEAELDIAKSYQLQANCYLTKPVQLDAFESIVRSINNFWLTRVKLPAQQQSA